MINQKGGRYKWDVRRKNKVCEDQISGGKKKIATG